jgi:hypothetical protein
VAIIDELLGDQLGSYFGVSLASADVNGDGCEELFVGAPFYNELQNRDSSLYDEGCVFVYSKSSVSSAKKDLDT